MTAVDLGPLKKLRIRHDNSHSHSSWYLDRVEIVDTKDDTTYMNQTASVYFIYSLCFVKIDFLVWFFLGTISLVIAGWLWMKMMGR